MEYFLKARLIGKRFEDHAIPLEFLKDFAVLEEMILDIAKCNYLKANPDRKRIPRGFASDVELKLSSIESGSAVACISIFNHSKLFTHKSIQKSRDDILRAINAANDNKNITGFVPEEKLGFFDRMGRSLRVNEKIEFITQEKKISAEYSKETRKKLVRASSKIKELTENHTLCGAISEVNQDKMTFQLQLANDKKVDAPIETQHLDAILNAFNGYKDNIKVSLQGIGRFDRKMKLLGFESIDQVDILDSLDIRIRIEELKLLKNGWLDGIGVAPNNKQLDWLANIFQEFYFEENLPYLYPTEEGNIQAEWTLGDNEITIEIDINKHTGVWHSLNMETDEETAKELNLGKKKNWEWINEQIKQMFVGAE